MGPLLPRSTDIPGLKGLRPPSHLVEFLMHGWVGGHLNFFSSESMVTDIVCTYLMYCTSSAFALA